MTTVNRTSQMVSGLLLTSTLLGNLGCAGTPPAARVIHEDAHQIVRLEVIYRSGSPEHSHPVKLSSDDMATVFKELSVTPRHSGSQQGPFAYAKQATALQSPKIFPDTTLDSLSHSVVEALQRATPAEDVVFYLNRPGREGTSEITSGSLYVEENTLHILFGNYRHPTVGPFEPQKAKAHPLEVLGQPLYEISPGTFGRDQHSRRLATFLTGAPQHLVIDYPALLKTKDRIEQQDVGVPDPHTLGPSQSLSGKLEELHHLREKKLISEEEYLELREKHLRSF